MGLPNDTRHLVEEQFADLDKLVKGECTESPQELVNRHLAAFEAHEKARQEMCKTLGICARCDAQIPLGGRVLINPITKETRTSCLCVECGKAMTKMVLDRVAQRKRERDAENQAPNPES